MVLYNKGMLKPYTGVLLPVFSLPSDQGIGCFGKDALHWIDKLKEAGMNAWQVCPLGPTGFGASPYQTLSDFALNPLFLEIEDLYRRDWISKEDLEKLAQLPKDKVNYQVVEQQLLPLFLKAYEVFAQSKRTSEFEAFMDKEGENLLIFSTFCALKEKFFKKPWWEWPEAYRNYSSETVQTYRKDYCKWVNFFAFLQWLLHEQWHKIHCYAKDNGITIIGDLPIYVGLDNATVWSDRDLFQWNRKADCPKSVAGVPPDYFSTEGQLWGNPVYRWSVHKHTQFAWWIERIKKQLEWFDVVRLDHARALFDYWAIPYGAKTAQQGEWKPGPKNDFLNKLKKNWPDMPFVVEDLGDLHEGVKTFLKTSKLPGMAVVQFAFSGENNPYMPEAWHAKQVIYTGTHDNDTTCGWFKSLNSLEQERVANILASESLTEKTVSTELICWIFKHRTTQHVIIPFQDCLNLDTEARINTPGTLRNNWQWRCSRTDFRMFLKKVKEFF